MTINTFALPFFNYCSLSLNRKKTCGNESHEKVSTETQKLNVIHASAGDLLHIRIGNLEWNESHEKETKHILASSTDLLHIKIENLSWCKCGHRKNEAREINLSLLQRGERNDYCFG